MLVARHILSRLPSSSRRAYYYTASSVTHNLWTSPYSQYSDGSSSLVYHTNHHQPSSSLPTSISYISHRTFATTLKESYENVLVEKRLPEDTTIVGGGVGIITLHRPKALNALSDALFDDLIHAAKAFEDDDDIGCIIITGSGKILDVY